MEGLTKSAIHGRSGMNPLTVRVLRECLEMIETKLREPIDVGSLAAASGYSLWHFQRVFQALVGETVGTYIRRRRLSESSYALVRTDARIVDIAVDFQFQSHEAYSRAFKRQFSVSPQQYRTLKRDRAQGPCRLSDDPLAHLDQHIQPGIVIEQEYRVVGIAGRFHRIRSEKYDGQTIADLWRRFFEQRHRVCNAVEDVALGVVSPSRVPDPQDDSEAMYVAGAQVTSTIGNPDSLEHVHIAPRTYALFDHHGDMADLRTTVDSIYAVWLVNNDRYTTDDSPVVEIYTKKFQHGHRDSVFSIAIPLVSR
jgi:AraC family transcriptional regulator